MLKIAENLKRYAGIDTICLLSSEIISYENFSRTIPMEWQMIFRQHSDTKQRIQLLWDRASKLTYSIRTMIDRVEEIGFVFNTHTQACIGLTYSWDSGKKSWLAKLPASFTKLQKIEEVLGITLPPKLTALMLCHDGLYFSGLSALGISSLTDIELLSAIDSEAKFENKDLTLGANEFISFAHDGIGNLLCLTKAETVGDQVFDWDHEARTINRVGDFDTAISRILSTQSWLPK